MSKNIILLTSLGILLLVSGIFLWRDMQGNTDVMRSEKEAEQRGEAREGIQDSSDSSKETVGNSEPIFDSSLPFQKAETEWVDYTSEEFKFSMKYPKGWMVDEKGDGSIHGDKTLRFWSPEGFEEMQGWRERNVEEQSPTPDISVNYEDMRMVGHNSLLFGSSTIEEYIQKNPGHFLKAQKIHINKMEWWLLWKKDEYGENDEYKAFILSDSQLYVIDFDAERNNILNSVSLLDFTREFLNNFTFFKNN